MNLERAFSMSVNPGYLLNEIAKQLPDKKAVVFKNEEITFLTLNRRSNRLAHVLSGIGIKSDDKVGMLLTNSPEFVVAYLAISKVGGIAIPLDMSLKYEDIEKILDYTEASILLCGPGADKGLSRKRPACQIEGESISLKGEVLEPPESDIGVERPLEAIATYLYTSGSTAERKLVMLTLGNLHCFPKVMREIYGTTSDEVYGMLLPMSHVSGPIAIQEMVEHGTELVIFDQLWGRSILRSIEKNKVTFIWGVRPIYRLIIQGADFWKFNTESLRLLAVMGMETSLGFMQELSKTFPHIAIVQGYGLTETSGVVIGTPPEDAYRKMNSIGRPASFVNVKIVDPQGRDVPRGQWGEVIIRGPAIMKGYYKDPVATEEKIKEGWLYTGDIGYFDEEGYLYYTGRKDDMIITSGYNVFPNEVESLIQRHPNVREVAVIGMPDPIRGEIIKAVVVPSSEISGEEILKFCRGNLPGYKCPRMIEFRKDLPKTSTGKIARSLLRRME